MNPEIAVVIPFFQREPGILGRALRSVSLQTTSRGIGILIVDDESPTPVETEVELPTSVDSRGPTVMILKRPNGGPGAARNTALAALPDSIRWVAFLDSDDEWVPEHLDRAIAALSAGFHFYFSDHLQLDQQTGAFARAGRLKPSEHEPIVGIDGVYAYKGEMLDQIIRGNVIGTSTVVFDRCRFPSIRFREDLTRAGEDYLCWMDFAESGAKFAFSTHCEAKYGRGVNVYAGVEWGTQQHLERVHNELRYRKMTSKIYKTDVQQQRFLNAKIVQLREEFVLSLLHMAKRRELPPSNTVAQQLIYDPKSALALVGVLASRLIGKKA